MMSRRHQEHREEQKRTRVVALAFLTPFFLIKGGMNVSLGAVIANLGLFAALLAAKMIPKVAFIYPLARLADRRHGASGERNVCRRLRRPSVLYLFHPNRAKNSRFGPRPAAANAC
jgi:Kef-type K+ transport system membrane component KefB